MSEKTEPAYCFSKPVMTGVSVVRPTAIVTRRDVWERSKQLDYTALAPGEYPKVYKVLRMPQITAEAMENIFQPQEPMTCDEFETMLKGWGLTYEPALDAVFADFADFFEE